MTAVQHRAFRHAPILVFALAYWQALTGGRIAPKAASVARA